MFVPFFSVFIELNSRPLFCLSSAVGLLPRIPFPFLVSRFSFLVFPKSCRMNTRGNASEQTTSIPSESTLAKVHQNKGALTTFRMNTYEKQGPEAHFAQFWCSVSPFRMNTCKSVSKQSTLTSFRMNTYEKTGGWGVLLLTRFQMRESVLRSIAIAQFASRAVPRDERSLFSLHPYLLCLLTSSSIVTRHDSSASPGGAHSGVN
jgi:hypothetical protein